MFVYYYKEASEYVRSLLETQLNFFTNQGWRMGLDELKWVINNLGFLMEVA